MKVTLHLAISADGFIAKPNGDSDWVAPADEELFMSRAREAGCLVVGKNTFDQYQGSIYPVDRTMNIILTRQPDLHVNGVMIADSPAMALEMAKKYGCKGMLIAGGARTSAAFLEAGLIDEIFFSVHPMILGEGLSPFGGMAFEKKVRLLGTKNLGDGLLELHYQVLR